MADGAGMGGRVAAQECTVASFNEARPRQRGASYQIPLNSAIIGISSIVKDYSQEGTAWLF